MIAPRTQKLIKHVDKKFKVISKVGFCKIATENFGFELHEATWIYDEVYLIHEPENQPLALKKGLT